MAKECPDCHMKPCMGGKGPGSCQGGGSEGGSRGGRGSAPSNGGQGHRHDYRMSRIISTTTVTQGKKGYKIRVSEYTCHNKVGTCDQPKYQDTKKIRVY